MSGVKLLWSAVVGKAMLTLCREEDGRFPYLDLNLVFSPPGVTPVNASPAFRMSAVEARTLAATLQAGAAALDALRAPVDWGYPPPPWPPPIPPPGWVGPWPPRPPSPTAAEVVPRAVPAPPRPSWLRSRPPAKSPFVGRGYLDDRNKRIDDQDVSVGLANSCQAANCQTLGDLADQTVQELLRKKLFGRKRVTEARILLGHVGLAFADDPPEVRMQLRLANMSMSVLLYKHCERMGLKTLGDLAACSAVQLLKRKGLGRKTLREAQDILSDNGLELRPTSDQDLRSGAK